MSDPVAIAKRVVRGETAGHGQQYFLDAIEARAAEVRKSAETREQAIARFMERDPDGQVLAAAAIAEQRAEQHGITGGAVSKGSAPMDELERAAEQVRKRNPKLTKEQAFEKAYTDPANRDLARAEYAARRTALEGTLPAVAAHRVAKNERNAASGLPVLTLAARELYNLIDDFMDQHPEATNFDAQRVVLASPVGARLMRQHEAERDQYSPQEFEEAATIRTDGARGRAA